MVSFPDPFRFFVSVLDMLRRMSCFIAARLVHNVVYSLIVVNGGHDRAGRLFVHRREMWS